MTFSDNSLKVTDANHNEWTSVIRKAKQVYVEVSGLHDTIPMRLSKASAIRFLMAHWECGFEIRVNTANEAFIDRENLYSSSQEVKVEDKQYNGWLNYETWLVNLWIDNEQSSHEECRELAKNAVENNDTDKDMYSYSDAEVSLASDLEQWVHNTFIEGLIPESGMICDLLNAAWQEVEWREIATHMIDAAIEDRNIERMDDSFHEFWQGYLMALAFTASEELGENVNPEPVWRSRCDEEWKEIAEELETEILSSKQIKELKEDCSAFFLSEFDLIEDDFERAGMCFHYSRNGHGIGFFDSEFDESDDLQAKAKVYSTCELVKWEDSFDILN